MSKIRVCGGQVGPSATTPAAHNLDRVPTPGPVPATWAHLEWAPTDKE